jgi:hypothetical protein
MARLFFEKDSIISLTCCSFKSRTFQRSGGGNKCLTGINIGSPLLKKKGDNSFIALSIAVIDFVVSAEKSANFSGDSVQKL